MIREIRQQKIMELITQRQGMCVGELRTALQVSAMTLHRDLRMLESKGMIRRVHGGVVISNEEHIGEQCSYCGRGVPTRTRMMLFAENGQRVLACCAHCGMGLMRHDKGLIAGLGVDFLYETVVDIPRSYFLVESDVQACCNPSVLVFARRADAERMQKGFGGRIMNYVEIYSFFVDVPSSDSPCGGSE